MYLSMLMLTMVSASSSSTTSSDSITAYYSYQNGQCIDETTIYGTAVLSFSDTDINTALGTKIYNYEGPCIYFKDGSVDITNSAASSTSSSNLFAEGYCMSCYGKVGCSSTNDEYACDNFMTMATTTNEIAYQLSNSNINNKHTEYETYQELQSPALTLQRTVTNTVSSQVRASNKETTEDGLTYYVLGGSASLIVIVGLVAFLEAQRQKRQEKERDQVFRDGMTNIHPLTVV